MQVEYVRSERTWLHPGQSAEILVDGQSIGYLGRLHPSLENELDLGTTWVAELDQTAVLQTYVSNFTELSRFPSVRRDIALLISDKINVSEIQQLIEKTGGALLDSTWLFFSNTLHALLYDALVTTLTLPSIILNLGFNSYRP